MQARLAQPMAMDINPDNNPYVGRMAHRLVRSFTANHGSDADRWALITEVLGFAAEAEQLLTEQRERISRLEAQTVTDDLTGVGNRRGLESFLRRVLANAERHGEEGIVAYFDIDDFKAVNDTHGHEAGDECLRTLAEFLTMHTRTGDYVARLGGDEFVVVLTHCPLACGRTRIRNLQAMLDGMTVHHLGVGIPLRTSTGVAPYRRGSTINTVLARADTAMYRDKRSRQNGNVHTLRSTVHN